MEKIRQKSLWEKPRIVCVDLKIEEALMQHCKGAANWGPGGEASSCTFEDSSCDCSTVGS